MTLNTTRSKVPYICVTNVTESQISPHFPIRPTAFEIYKVVNIRKCTKRPQNDIERLTIKNAQYILSTYPQAQISVPSVLLYDQPFSRYKVLENRKCAEQPQTNFEHLRVKSTLYTLSAYPLRPKF